MGAIGEVVMTLGEVNDIVRSGQEVTDTVDEIMKDVGVILRALNAASEGEMAEKLDNLVTKLGEVVKALIEVALGFFEILKQTKEEIENRDREGANTLSLD